MSAVVIQADREATAGLLEELTGSKSATSMKMRRGEADDYTEVQAFATHRTEATAELLEALQRIITSGHAISQPLHRAAEAAIARAIGDAS